MYIWNPLKLKELKEKGYKIKIYDYIPEFQEKTIEQYEESIADETKEED